MQRTMLKSKIHRAVVTGCDRDYEGSLAIDERLMESADLLPGERIEIYNITNGHRLATYAIKAERDSGRILMNGAAAHLASPGDLVIICSYCAVDDEFAGGFAPRIVHVDEHNRPR